MTIHHIVGKTHSILSLILSVIVLSLASQCGEPHRNGSEESLETLKQAVAKREHYLEKKLSRIDSIRQQLHSPMDASTEFAVCKTLFNMYYDLQIDTALWYAEHMLDLSKNALRSQSAYQTESQFLIARVYAYTGMYKECEELLEDEYLMAENLSEELKRLYFLVKMELYKGLGEQTISERELNTYMEVINECQDSLITLTPQNSIWHLIHLGNKLTMQEDYDRAEEIFYKGYTQLTTDDREMAQVAFYLSNLYRRKGDLEQEKRYLIISSIADVKHAVKEYVSLWKLAAILHNEGEIETAYQFIEISLQDAMYSGAYRWTQYIIRILPDIYASYKAQILQQKKTISWGFLIIVCLLACSILLSLYIVRQYRKLDKAKSQLSKMNDDLKAMNTELNSLSDKLHLSNIELKTTNDQLLFLNNELVSTNLLKETYLSKFIDLCADYIDKLDEYRGSLKRLLKGGKVEKIEKELESTKYIEKEHRSFLTNFDETFLNLHPNFVFEFNSLFPEEEQQKIRENELLTTELRVFALIRLGITDSSKIAKFLRCSITTIYTYRSKIKNKSYYPDSFEERIKECQKQDYFSLSSE